MAYSGATPTSVPLSGDDLSDGIISEAKLADDAVSLAKMKAGVDGTIISFDASTNPVAIAVGSSGSVLTSGGAGAAPSFAVAGFPIGAGAYVTGGQAIANNSATTLIGNTESYDPNSDYNASNGTYTVPSGQAGKYMVTGHISIPCVDATLLGLGVKVDGTAVVFQAVYPGKTDTGAVTVAIILELAVGEAVTWYCHHQAGSSKTTQASAYGTGMSIQQIA